MRLLTLAMCSLIYRDRVRSCLRAAGRGRSQDTARAWTATRAERDGKAAKDAVGHRLSFSGNRPGGYELEASIH